MKKYIPLIIIGVLIVAFAAGYFILKASGEKEGGTLYSFASGEEVESVDIVNTYGAYSFRTDAEGEWQVVSDGMSYRASDTKMELLLSSLKSFTVERYLSAAKTEYGLDEPVALVRFTTTAGNSHTFMVGAESADVSSVYVQNVDNDRVLITDSASVAQLNGSLNAYRSKDVFTVDTASTRRIEYYQLDELIVSVYTEDGVDWYMDYPYEAPARQIELTEFVSAMGGWSIAGYPDAGTTAEQMGLHTPAETVVITDSNGESQTIQLGYEQDVVRFACIGGDNDDVALYATDVDLSVLRPDTLLFIAPLKATIDEIESISINDGSDEYLITYDAATELAALNGFDLSYDEFVGIFFKYISLVAAGRDGEGTPGATVAKFTTVYKDGRTAQLELMERDGETLFMSVDGETNYYLKTSKLTGLLERLHEAAE